MYSAPSSSDAFRSQNYKWESALVKRWTSSRGMDISDRNGTNLAEKELQTPELRMLALHGRNGLVDILLQRLYRPIDIEIRPLNVVMDIDHVEDTTRACNNELFQVIETVTAASIGNGRRTE